MSCFNECGYSMNEVFGERNIWMNEIVRWIFYEWNASVNKMFIMNEFLWWIRCFNEYVSQWMVKWVLGWMRFSMNEYVFSMNMYFQWMVNGVLGCMRFSIN